MKISKLLPILLGFCLLFGACASRQPVSELSTATPAPAPVESRTPAPETTPAPEPTSEPAPELRETPYIEMVGNPDQPIYSGPGYDFEKVSTVKIATGYTIMEELIDYEGNLWGRLKSGAGWIDLTDARAFDGSTALVSASYAQGLGPEDCDYALPDGGEYYNYIEFNVKSTVTDVQLLALELAFESVLGDFGDYYSAGETLHTVPSLDPHRSYIVALVFPGDMSAYGLRCTDEKGTVHEYVITISMRNGELVLEEHIPLQHADFRPPDAEIPPQPTPDLDIQTS